MITQVAAALNVVLVGGLFIVWARNYREHGARHTLGLLSFAGFLSLQSVIAFFLYTFQPAVRVWLKTGPPTAQIGILTVTVLEFFALVVLTRITWI